MDTGNLKALIQQVPWWRMSLLKYERVRVEKKMDDSLFGVRMSSLCEMTPSVVLPWEQIDDTHVTTQSLASSASTVASVSNASDIGANETTVWLLGAYEHDELSIDDLALVILPQHVALYRALTVAGDRRLRCRLIGSGGTGKSLACLYILIRELAAGKSVAVLNNTGKVELMVWRNRRLLRLHNLPTSPCRESLAQPPRALEDKNRPTVGTSATSTRVPTVHSGVPTVQSGVPTIPSGVRPVPSGIQTVRSGVPALRERVSVHNGVPKGESSIDVLRKSMVVNQVIRADSTKLPLNKIYSDNRGILIDELIENREDHSHCWTSVTGKFMEREFEILVKRHIRSTSFFDGLTTRTRLTLSDEESGSSFKPPCYALQTMVSLFTSAHNVPMVTEWYWPGVTNPMHVGLCRQLRNAVSDKNDHIDGEDLEYVAGRNLRVAMLCHIMNSVSWSFTPVNNILSHLSAEELIDFLSPQWPTNHSWLQRDRRFIADCYLPEHLRVEYVPGQTCVGLLLKRPASNCIKTFALRRLVRLPTATLYRLSGVGLAFNALVRQRLARSGIEINLKRSKIKVNATSKYMVMFNDGGFRHTLRRKSLYPETEMKHNALTREARGDGVRYINVERIIGKHNSEEAEMELLDRGVRIGVWTSAKQVPRRISPGALERYDCCVFAFPRQSTTRAFHQLKQCEHKSKVAVWLLDAHEATLLTDCSFRAKLRYWAGRYFGCE